MKRFSWIYAFLLVSVCLSAQTVTQKGVTYRYNGKNPRTPIGSVTISYDGNKRSVLSDEKSGSFSLMLENLKMGDRIGLVTVKKREMMVFNQHAVDEWSIRKEPLVLILCNADEFEQQKANLIEIGKREAKKKYDRQKAELEAKLSACQMKQQEYEVALDKAYEELERFQKNVGEYADLFARIDESEVDTLAQRALDLFNQGKVDEAIRLFEQGHYMERLDRALKNSQQADQLKTIAEQAKEQATQDSLKALQSLKAQIEAYKLNNEWNKAGKLLKGLADRLNTEDAVWNYAYYCECQNNHIDAIQYYNRVLELNKKSCLPDDSITYMIRKASILNNIASMNFKLNHIEESEKLYLEALDIRRKLMEKRITDVRLNYAHTLANLAILYTSSFRPDKSISMFKEAKTIYQEILTDNTLSEYTELLVSYAYQLSKARLFEDSKNVYTEALSKCRLLANNNPKQYNRLLATALNSMATLYLDYSYYSDAEPLFMESLSIRREIARDNPEAYEPSLAQTLYNISLMYQEMNRPEECESYYKECIDVSRKNAVRSPEAYNPKLADALNNLGNFYLGQKRYIDSEKTHKEALEIRRNLMNLNPSSFKPDVTQSLFNMGILKIHQDFNDDAIIPLTECVEICRSISNPNKDVQKRYLNSLWALYQIYQLKKDRANQNSIFELLSLSVESFKTVIVRNSDELSTALGSFSYNAVLLKLYEKAEDYAREALSVDSSKHWIASNLAAALLFQGKYDEAEKIYLQYKDGLKEYFLDDFKQFADAGVIPKEYEADVERIKKLLNE